MKFRFFTALIILLVIIVLLKPQKVIAPVPVTVWGYVYMPNGSKASGAAVTVKGGGDTKTTTTGSDGKYSVTLSVASTPTTVTVTAKKGEYSGSASKSNVEGVVQINVHLKKSGGGGGGAPPRPSKKPVKLELYAPREVSVNSTVIVKGYTSPARVNATVKIVVKGPAAIAFENYSKTNNQGCFNYSFSPWTTGLWKITAICKGNNLYYDASATIEILVKKRSFLTLNIDPSVAVVGSSVKLYGCITPEVDTVIKLYFSFDNSTWFNIMDVNTTNGCYELEWIPNLYGLVYLKAYWNGSSEYFGSETYNCLKISYRRPITLVTYAKPSTILAGENISINIKIKPYFENAVVELEFSRNGIAWEKMADIILDTEGWGSMEWSFEDAGAYVIRACLRKTEDYERVCNFTVVNVIKPTILLVLDASGQPLAGARIIIKNDENKEYVLSSDGTAVLALKPGSYEVDVFWENKLIGSFRADLGEGGIVIKSLGGTLHDLPSHQVGIRVALYDLPVLVFDDDGMPVLGQKVELISAETKMEGVTDEKGLVIFRNVPPGNYIVTVNSIEKSISIPDTRIVYIRIERMNLFGDRVKEIMFYAIIALIALTITLVFLAARKS